MTMFFVSISCGLAVLAGDGHLAGRDNLAGAAMDVDLVLLHQEIEALDVLLDRHVLVRQHLLQIELRLADLDAERIEDAPASANISEA